MSLRAFHIVFVTVCTLLFGFLAVWGLWASADRSPLTVGFGVVGLVGLIGMPIYGVCFYRKAKKLVL
ncbi:hypothetical protein [Luteolibacter sp. LG18]|uniref:hypothetical protein n=1 Tax=Luteolibacter sp. LG18 TaxID=2819286 RepID=UPI002B28F277|nr:hypothetical protein llg_05000 [Luteolibacter sp. LG18]